MRLILQRVKKASVEVAGAGIRSIGPGLMILIGITHEDTLAEAAYMADKAMGLRIFDDDAGHLNRSLLDTGGECLIVSNFTLYANCRKGRRPSFVEAARPETAIPLYEAFVEAVKQAGVSVQTGEFGGDMQVEIHNDGPVTVLLDSQEIMPGRRGQKEE
ncbi:D-aminoacyl-tRNA deacylase [Oscillospiraceae bacterium MB08-C2-2]|nr:D-aminoacyl-tRNA deacylase [Oscillospiraceae bacterium MB08-C2-2]